MNGIPANSTRGVLNWTKHDFSRLPIPFGNGWHVTANPAMNCWSATTKRTRANRASPGRSRLTKHCVMAGSTGFADALIDESYSIRFTPRRPRSIWSARNIERVQVLLREKRMQPAGIRAYEKRTPERSGNYAYEQALVGFNEKYEAQFRKRKKAWAFFQSLPPSVRKPSIWWVCSARKEETRQSRLSKLIECCQKEERLPQFIRPANPRKKK